MNLVFISFLDKLLLFWIHLNMSHNSQSYNIKSKLFGNILFILSLKPPPVICAIPNIFLLNLFLQDLSAPPLRGHRFMSRARAVPVNLCYSVVVITWDFESHDRGSNPCSTSSVFRVPPLLLIYRSREPMAAIPCARQTF